MVSKVIKIKGGEYVLGPDGRIRAVETYFGLSTDPKPTEGVNNADRYLEMDKGTVSIYDEDNKTWWPL